MNEAPLVVWGPELSPFLLKLESMLTFAGLPFRRLPRDGGRLENLRTSRLVSRAVATKTARRPDGDDPLDEYPLVPFLVRGPGEVLYDSSALAAWIDARADTPRLPPEAAAQGRLPSETAAQRRLPPETAAQGRLLPEEAGLRWVASFLDEAFDELGLYMVHHNRWKLAAGDNLRPGLRLAREYRRQLPPGAALFFAPWFERRQVRRLPYLFSVAPEGYRVPNLSRSMTPPSLAGFPPTHEILEESWRRTLEAMEKILRKQRWLLGGRFTIADASAYGQLSMNLTDGLAARTLRDLAPRTFGWLVSIRSGDHVGTSGPLAASPSLTPLLELFAETFVPLMRANEAAYERLAAGGATVFNEKAFDARTSLFDGELLGRPYRSVAKTFQVRTWRELCRGWTALDPHAQAEVAPLFGQHDPRRLFDRDPDSDRFHEEEAGPTMRARQ